MHLLVSINHLVACSSSKISENYIFKFILKMQSVVEKI